MRKMFLFLTAIVILCSQGNSQTTLNDFAYHIYYQTTSTDPLVFDTVCTRVCKVEIPDTNSISKIHVSIGTTEDATDILDYAFQYDVISGLPTGLSYFREGNFVYLGLFETTKADTYFYKIWLEDISGDFTEEKKWN